MKEDYNDRNPSLVIRRLGIFEDDFLKICDYIPLIARTAQLPMVQDMVPVFESGYPLSYQ